MNYVCTDIDECKANRRICQSGKKCENKPGTFACVCKDGFKESKNGTCKGIS